MGRMDQNMVGVCQKYNTSKLDAREKDTMQKGSKTRWLAIPLLLTLVADELNRMIKKTE